jgi:hypothetical protein
MLRILQTTPDNILYQQTAFAEISSLTVVKLVDEE